MDVKASPSPEWEMLVVKISATQQATAITTYTYSSRGEVLNVTLPDSRFIEYDHNPLSR